jgi:hypothetical protein
MADSVIYCHLVNYSRSLRSVQNFMEFYSEGQANSISGVMEIDDYGLGKA